MTPLTGALTTLVFSLVVWWLALGSARNRPVALGPSPILAFAATAIMGALVVRPGDPSAFPFMLIALVTICAIVDVRTGVIFDSLTYLVIVVAMIASIGVSESAAFGGAFVAGGTLMVLYFLTDQRGIGLGDVKLAAGIGAGLGPTAALVAIGTAFILGGAYGAALIATKRATGRTAIRFGPFLAAGTYAALVLRGTIG